MDINDLRAMGTVFCLIAFAGIVWWAYAPSRRSRFDAAARLPFDDESPESVRRDES